MSYAIRAGKRLSLKAKKEREVPVNFASFLIQNCGDVPVYFKDKDRDETAVSEKADFALMGGETMPVVLSAKTLGLMAMEDTEVCLLFVNEN